MASRLSSLLVRDGLVGVKRMENAFQRQVIYGGCLDTILLEMNLIPENRLLQYLSLSTGLPPATQAETNVFDAQAVLRCPVDLAREFRVVPLCFEEGALRVLIHDPVELSLLEDLANELECPVQPLVVPEYRFHMVFARTFGGTPNDRFVALAQRAAHEEESAPVGRARSIIVEQEGATGAGGNDEGEHVIVDVDLPRSGTRDDAAQQAAEAQARQRAQQEAQAAEQARRYAQQVAEEQARRHAAQVAEEQARQHAAQVAEEQARQHAQQEAQAAEQARRQMATAHTERIPPAEQTAPARGGRRAHARETILGVGLPGGDLMQYNKILQEHLQGLNKAPATWEPQPQAPEPQAQPQAPEPQAQPQAPEIDERPTAMIVDEALLRAEPVVHPDLEVLELPVVTYPAQPMPVPAKAQAPAGTGGTPLDAESAAQALTQADDRDAIFELLLRAIRDRAWYAALLTVQGGAAIGRVAIIGDEIDRERIADVLIPLDIPSAFKTVVESGAPHAGPIVTHDPEIDSMLERMGGILPNTAMLLPIVLKGRVVAVAVGHEGERDVEISAMGDLRPLAELAAKALLRVLMRAKSQQRREPEPTLPKPPVVTVKKSAAAGKASVPDDFAYEPTHPMAEALSAPEQEFGLDDTIDRGDRGDRDDYRDYDDGDDDDDDDGDDDGPEISIIADEPAVDYEPLPVVEYTPMPEPATPTEISMVADEPELVDDLLDTLESSDDPGVVLQIKAELTIRRREALRAIFARFPGTLTVERYDLAGRILPAAQHGPLLAYIVELGEAAVDHLIPVMSSKERDVRYYATLCMAEIRSQKAVDALADRVFDSDYGTRSAAVDALAGYPLELLQHALKHIRGALADADPIRVQAAARALGEITAVGAIPDLLDTIARGGKFADYARRALSHLTRQDFGTSARKWRGWWKKNQDKTRMEWLLDGLAHKDENLRRASVEELRKLTGEFFDYQFDASKRDRETARKAWLAWWNETGRHQFE